MTAPAPLAALRLWLSRQRVALRWFLQEGLRDPGFALYARRAGRRDRSAFLADRAAGAAAIPTYLAPFDAPDVPRVIWIYWDRGEAEAPFVVRRCIETWRQHNPGWEVRVLDAGSVQDFADMSDVPAHLPQRFFADLLRLRLLRAHGGVWADATVYCHRPLETWMPLQVTTGFFALRHPGPGRWISSWFLIAAPGHVLPTLWEAAFARFLRRSRRKPDLYFILFYIFQWQLRRDPEALAAWRRAPSLPAQPSFVMLAALQGQIGVDQLDRLLRAGLPVSKLSWKQDLDEAAFDAFCSARPELARTSSPTQDIPR